MLSEWGLVVTLALAFIINSLRSFYSTVCSQFRAFRFNHIGVNLVPGRTNPFSLIHNFSLVWNKKTSNRLTPSHRRIHSHKLNVSGTVNTHSTLNFTVADSNPAVTTHYVSVTHSGFAVSTFSAPRALFSLYSVFQNWAFFIKSTVRRFYGEGFSHVQGLCMIFAIDALLTDDEPLWEPVEWSMAQTWVMFIFAFAWIAENLISSRYGSFTGRDKRVWFSWYKTFWLIEGWYVLSMGAAAMFVIVPFYYEITYSTAFIVSWWHWYSRVFFFKFISIYTIALLIAFLLQISLRWVNWSKSFMLILTINFFLGYLLYTNFFMAFFGYFTDVSWYRKTRLVDYVQLSHEPNKWSWGSAKRDHFSYHRSTTVFWFKNDGPFAGAFLFFHLFFFVSLFFLNLFWVVLARRVYATRELTHTYTAFCVSSLRQFFYFFLFMYLLVLISFIMNYWRFPVEFFWMLPAQSWVSHFWDLCLEYPFLLLGL